MIFCLEWRIQSPPPLKSNALGQMHRLGDGLSTSQIKEMNAQAIKMKGMVEELAILVEGNSKGNVTGGREAIRLAQAPVHRDTTFYAKKAVGQEVAVHRAKEVRPDQVIPMDDQDFRDF